MIDRRSFMQSAAAAVTVAAVPVVALAGERRIVDWRITQCSVHIANLPDWRQVWNEWRPVYDDGSVGPVVRTIGEMKQLIKAGAPLPGGLRYCLLPSA